MAKLTKEEIIQTLKEMTLLEINDLVKTIESTFGVSASVAVGSATVEAAPAVVEKPTSVNVILQEAGANKIGVIKTFREVTGMGLMEAKTAVEKAPTTIKENIKIEEAEGIKTKFEAVGAKIKFE